MSLMEEPEQIFRKEALEYYSGAQEQGHVLRLSPSWTRWTFWLLLGAVGFYGAFGVLGWVSEYASGPAVVRAVDRLEVTAPSAGRVSSVEIQPGQRVKEGQILIRFFAGEEQASLTRFNQEFEHQLLRRMDPQAPVVSSGPCCLTPNPATACRPAWASSR